MTTIHAISSVSTESAASGAIRVARCWKGIIPLQRECDLAVFLPPLNARAASSFLAGLLSRAMERGVFENEADAVLITHSANKTYRTALDWIEKLRIPYAGKRNVGGLSAVKLQRYTLWIGAAKDLQMEDLPFTSLDCAVICEAHSVSYEIANRFRQATEGSAFIAVSEVPRTLNHWTMDLPEKKCVSAADVVAAYPDQRSKQEELLADLSRAEIQRFVEVRPDVVVTTPPITRFAKRRLWIRTDKPVALLSPEQQAMVDARIEGSPVLPFYLSKLQRRYLAMKRLAIKQGKRPRFLLLKYRRGGFTTLEQAQSYRLCVSSSHAQAVTLAQTRESTNRIFRMVSIFHEKDPRKPRLANDSKSSLDFADSGSTFFIGTAGGRGFSRGDTLQRVHGSEVSKWCDGSMERVEDLVAGLLGAASNGEVVLETTPNGYEWFAHTYKEAKNGVNDWIPLFLPWYMDPLNRVLVDSAEERRDIMSHLSDEEKAIIERAKRDYGRRIGAEEIAWRRRTKREFGRLFVQEYPEDDVSCFITSGTPFYNNDLLLILLERWSFVEDVKQLPGGYVVEWEPPSPNVQYVAGSDTSEGLPGGDLNGTGIMRKDNGRQVAAIHGRWRPDKLGEHSLKLVKRYNEALWGIERNNHGHSVIQWVKEHGGSRYRTDQLHGGRLYHHGATMKDAGRAGWPTDVVTRPLLLDDLYEWFEVDTIADLCRDREFMRECTTFKLQKNGNFEADPGCHDDTVFKWGIANQMRKINIAKATFTTG
jgi:hypothetical protein